MKNKKPTVQPYTMSGGMQLILVSTILAVFIIQAGRVAYHIVVQYLDNPHVGGAYGYFASTELLPVALFVIAYALNPRKLSRLSRTLESILITIAAVSVWQTVVFMLPQLTLGSGSFIENYARYQIVSSIGFILLSTAVLFWFRQTKRWK